MIETKHLSLDLGEFRLEDINLRVRPGEYFVVLGPTGAGKTLLIEAIAGLLQPDTGEIWIGGTNVTRFQPEARKVGYVPQDYALFPHLNVERNIGFGLSLGGSLTSEMLRKIKAVARLLGISHLLHRHPITLSGGEKQRAALARALAIEPQVMLLDEPLSALDVNTREDIYEILQRIHHEVETTIIHISHNFEETLALAERIAVLNKGKLIQIGTTENIFRRPATLFVAHFVRATNVYDGVARRRIDEQNTFVISAAYHRKVDGKAGPVGTASQRGESSSSLMFATTSDVEGQCHCTIRPEDMELFITPPDPNKKADNCFEGTVSLIRDRGATFEVEVDIGVPIVAFVNRRKFYADGISIGSSVCASFEKEAVHLLPAGESEQEGQ